MTPEAARGRGLLLRRYHSEQAIGIVIGSCSEEELVGLTCSSTIAELYGPDLVNLDRLAVRVSQHPKECAGMEVERVNPAFGNVVGHQQRAAE